MRVLLNLLLGCLFTVVTVSTTKAQLNYDVTVKQVIYGGDFNYSPVAYVEDQQYNDPAYTPYLAAPYPVKNIITLSINEDSEVFNTCNTYSADVTVGLTYTLFDGNTYYKAVDLHVDYDKAHPYKMRHSFVFEGAVMVEAVILGYSTSCDPYLLKVENEMRIMHRYQFNCSNDVVGRVHFVTPALIKPDELGVYWQNIIPANFYDLEWAYIDSSALANLKYGNPVNYDKVFEDNASRITVSGNSYQIPLMYDNTGTLFFRVRPVQLQPDGRRTEGHWSADYTSTNTGRYVFHGHERKLNWQSSVTFAEDGKRKVVVQYFDGSLKSRQTVTKDNSIGTTVVAESFYDFQGRPVIQVLPAPTLNTVISYTKNFNVGINGDYDKVLYDSLPAGTPPCGVSAAGLTVTSGASNYYSTSNPLAGNGDHNAYIPDAQRYPFTETAYTQDNTGRISSQGGVGPNHQLGSGHETKYFYGGYPDQKELDALFGTEAGDRTHYQKNMVRDANGQYSVSYVDMHGRTVATALAGDAPQGLDALPSKNTQTITETLSDSGQAVIRGLTMETKKSLLVPKAGNYTFHYGLNPESLKRENCQNNNICYDCLYDLRITITDDCGNSKLPRGQAFDTVIHNFSFSAIDTTCNNADSFKIDLEVFLAEGNYEVTKLLTVSSYGEAYYKELFLRNNTCKTLDQFIKEQKDIFLSHVQCVPSCQACLDSTGTYDEFKMRYMNAAGIAIADSAANHNMMWAAWQDAVAGCDQLCNKIGDDNDYRKSMLLDMTPAGGQYANPDAIDAYSIFYFDYTARPVPYYRSAGIIYKDANGNVDYVTEDVTGTSVLPQQLPQDQFIAKFKSSWAEALLPFHPEYCKLLKYETFHASHVWDRAFGQVETYAEANSRGYLNPINGSYPYQVNSSYTDPLAATHSTELADALTNYYYDANSGHISLWNFATIMGMCKENDASCVTSHLTGDAFNTQAMCEGELNVAWQHFRELYLNKKREIIQASVDAACSAAVSASTLVTDGHTPYFISAGTAASAYGLGVYSGSAAAATAAANDTLSAYQASVCEAYVSQWIEQLAPCNYPKSDLDHIIIPELIAVCRKGSNVSHPYGSSSIAPDSSNTYNSFEEVLEAYNTAHGITSSYTCNEYIITAPQPYNQQQAQGNVPVLGKPSDCQCGQITNLYNEFALTGTGGTFAGFLQQRYNTVISEADLNTLLKACKGEDDCKFFPHKIELPPVFQCYTGAVCATCDQVDGLYQRFRTKYGVAPAYNETSQTQAAINQSFARFMNSQLGYSYTAADYLIFMRNCYNEGYVRGCTPDTIPTMQALNNVGFSCTAFEQFINEFNNDTNGDYPCQIVFTDRFNQRFNTAFSLCDIIAINNLYCHLELPCNICTDAIPDFNVPNFDCTTYEAMLADAQQSFGGDCNDWPGYFTDYFNGYYQTAFNFNQIALLTQLYCPRSFSGMLTYGTNSCTPYGAGDCEAMSIFFDDYYNNNQPAGFEEFQTTIVSFFNQAFHLEFSYCQVKNYFSNLADLFGIDDLFIRSLCAFPDYKYLPTLCGKSAPVFGPVQPDSVSSCSDSTFISVSVGTELYNHYRDSLRNNFEQAYRAQCLDAYRYESFTVTHNVTEYHYTLYYYDQAGNLVKTVPPAGVHAQYAATYLDSVAAARAAGTTLVPAHTLVTQYRYNTLNQVTGQVSPDGGASYFWYDRLGRLVASRNAKQAGNGQYSYTLYDALGRITEVGQREAAATLTDSISRSNTAFTSWVGAAGSNRAQVTRTVYDVPYAPFATPPTPLLARNLRNRVAYTQVWDLLSDNLPQTATYYSYDIHGNVDTLLQDYTSGVMNDNGNRFKQLVYNYDLVSGKVNQVAYQPGKKDAFYHRYWYDAENRLTDVETSHDSLYWEHDAAYTYYKHGPLARTVLGHQKVQGVDYAYTIHGWLKGINSTKVGAPGSWGSAYDMGKDGYMQQAAARDVFGLGLWYYGDGDYQAVGDASRPPFDKLHGAAVTALYNGNIAGMGVNLPGAGSNRPLVYLYGYDQLNRLTGMQAHDVTQAEATTWDLSPTDDFRESVSYDANGNITEYERNGNGSTGPQEMDRLRYHYVTGRNQLDHVRDDVPAGSYTTDIDDQGAGNYQYDGIGNLVSDAAEGIDDIQWTVYGKIASIHKNDGTTISYTYDASGNRISKRVSSGGNVTTWYVRDASGNVMSVYTASETEGSLVQGEVHMYGSSRLGMTKPVIDVTGTDAADVNPEAMDGNIEGNYATFERGRKFFELSNHLGNVLATVSDKRFGLDDDGNTFVDIYEADVVSVQDYYPFGMQMPGRSYSNGQDVYRYGFNGKERNNEINESDYDLGERMYDARIGRMKSIDRFFKKYPYFSPYQYAGNSPIKIMDNNGDSLRVAGGVDEIKKFTTMLNTVFSGKIKVSVDANGFVSLAGNPAKLSATSKALYNALNTVIADKNGTADVVLLGKTQGGYAIGGAWQGATVHGKRVNTLDLYDMEKFTAGGVSAQGMMIHEIWETYQDQLKGNHKYEDAHNAATKTQGKVDGTTVGAQWGDFDATGTGKGYTLFTKNGKYYTAVAAVNKMDVTGVTIKDGWIVKDKKGNLVTISTPSTPKTKKP